MRDRAVVTLQELRECNQRCTRGWKKELHRAHLRVRLASLAVMNIEWIETGALEEVGGVDSPLRPDEDVIKDL